MAITEYFSSLADNPYFGAGSGIFALGLGAAALRRVSQGALILLRRHLMITLEVPCRDKSYQWLLQWITQKGARQTQHLSVETSFLQKDSGHVQTKYDFIPSTGTHIMFYGGTWIKVERTRESHTLDLHMGVPWETVTLTAFGRNKNIYFQMLEEARQLALKSTEGKTIMYTADSNDWKPFGHPRARRPLNSVVLDSGISERISDDCKEFILSSKWYAERGIPYRRGYLLHGPPGCGKSSFVTALAGELEYGICLLNMSNRAMDDSRLNGLLNIAPQQTIILLEDIDAAFVNREDTDEQKAAYRGLNRVTLSGLLNALDGVASSEGRIVFMTTNYLDRLDAALIRPGRVDMKQYIGHCTRHQLEQMYRRFYSGSNVDEFSSKFADNVLSANKPVSPAMVQGYFMIHKLSPPQKVVESFAELWKH